MLVNKEWVLGMVVGHHWWLVFMVGVYPGLLRLVPRCSEDEDFVDGTFLGRVRRGSWVVDEDRGSSSDNTQVLFSLYCTS